MTRKNRWGNGVAAVCKDRRTAWENGNHKLHDVERSGVLEYDRTANGISGYEITVAGGVVCAADYRKRNWCFVCCFYSCTNFTVLVFLAGQEYIQKGIAAFMKGE